MSVIRGSTVVAELWMLTQTVLTSIVLRKRIFVVQLLMWAGPYIPVNYPYYEHANSCGKRWRLTIAANGWHNRNIRNLSQCLFVLSGCLAPCFVLLGGECLRIQTGNYGNTLYMRLYNTRKEISTACIQTLITLKLQLVKTLNVYQKEAPRWLFMIINNSKSIKFRLPTKNNK